MKKTLILLLGALAFSAPPAFAQQPNVIFILADDLGWSDTTLYGHTQLYQTPNIQRLAASGMLFTRAYTPNPLCSPTRASIMTGLHPARLGITSAVCHVPDVRLAATVKKTGPADQKSLICYSATRLNTTYYTLAEAMKAAGYATGHFGKWHLGPEPYSPLQQGFDVDLPHTSQPGPPGSYLAPWNFPASLGFTPNTPNEHIEDRMANEAVAWMTQKRQQNPNQPFFLNYWHFSVHSPFQAKPALIQKYSALIDPTDAQRSPTYAAMIETMDKAVGKLLDAVDSLGIANNTVIVFTADNGGNMYDTVDGTTPTSNRPLRGGKANVYEGGIRVPCVISWPTRTTPGSTSNAVIQSTDFYPTFVDLLGLTTQPGQIFDGISIAPTFANQPLTRNGIFTYFPHGPGDANPLPPSVSFINDKWKLIRLFYQGEQGAHAYELYNLETDIGETNNVAAGMPLRVSNLDAKIEQFLTNTQAVIPLPNPDYDPTAP